MTVQYPVHFTEVDNCILIEVPDLEILTQGRNMKDAIYMAKDAIKLMCEAKRDHHEKLPQPSKVEDVQNSGTFQKDGPTRTLCVVTEFESEEKKG